jgi:tetratricopeptide (TPR) repeat protein
MELDVQTTGSSLPIKHRRRWFIPALIAAISFIGGVASNLLASDLEEVLKPYRTWVWLLCAVALIIAVAAAIRDHLQVNAPQLAHIQTTQQKLCDSSATPIPDDTLKLFTIVPSTVDAPHQLPSPPRDFTGREAEIAELMAVLETAVAAIAALQGQGGAGKTALALKLSEMLKPRYPDAQFYLDLNGVSAQSLAPAEAMAHVVRAYYPMMRLPENETELGGLYRSVLDGKRILLLMDNAKDRAQVEPLIPPASCAMLITSRQHFVLPGLFAKSLDTMPPAEARELLIRIAPRIGEQADGLAKLCGYLPLPMRLAASTLAERPNITPAAYTQRLRSEQKRLELIEASLNLSHELLSIEQQERWPALAVFPETFNEAAAASVWGVEPGEAQEYLSELLACSLVEWNEASARYRLHDLTRVFAESRLSEAERTAARLRHATHYQNVLASANNLYLEDGRGIARGLEMFDLERANIEAGQAWMISQADSDNEIARLCLSYLSSDIVIVYLRFYPRQRISLLEASLKATRKLMHRGGEGVALHQLGIVHRQLGETSNAVMLLEQALAIHREIGDRKGESRALYDLGISYNDLTRPDKAAVCFQQSLVIHRELGDRRGEGNDLRNLGISYRGLAKTEKAIDLIQQALVIHREVGDRRGEGFDLDNLGHTYLKLGEARRTIEYCEQALTIHREIGDRRGQGFALWNLSRALNQLGERAEAIKLAEASLKIREEIEDQRAENIRKQLAEWKEAQDGGSG